MSVAAERGTVTVTMRPRHEGANIRTWVGFKHLMYLVEEAALEWFRQQDLGPQRLYHEYGLGLAIVDSSVLLPSLVEVDDCLRAETTAVRPGELIVTLHAARAGELTTAVRGKVRVAVVREDGVSNAAPAPPALARLIVPGVADPASARRDVPLATGDTAAAALAAADPRAAHWAWTARYFYCHYSRSVQHSAYVRALEEAADRFLADRGLPIGPTLDDRGWIPVVSRARVRLLDDASMDETIHTTFAVDGIAKNLAYECRMDCYAERGTTLAHVATGRMLQGYAMGRGAGAGRLVTLDDATVRALTGGSS